MGGALLKGWLARGVGPITVVEPKPSAGTAQAGARAKKITLVAAPSEVEAENLRLRGRDQAAGAERRSAGAGGFRRVRRADDFHRRGHLDRKSLFKAWGPKARIIRAMPNTPGAIGQGITGLYAAKGATAADRKRAEALLSALGETVWVDEGRFDRQRHGGVGLRSRLSVPDGGSPDRGGHGRRPAARPGRKTRPRHRGGRRRLAGGGQIARRAPCAKPSPVPAAPPRRRWKC